MKKVVLISFILVAIFSFNSYSQPEGISLKELFKHNNLKQIIKYFDKDGYMIIGPIQVVGFQKNCVKFYNFPSIKAKHIKVLNAKGKAVKLKKDDFVYVFKKKDYLIIIKIQMNEKDV